MKSLLLFAITIIVSGCTVLSKNSLNRVLEGNSFEWHIIQPDTSFVYEMHFLQDSIYVIVGKASDVTIFSSPGYWCVKGGPLSTALWTTSRISPTSTEIKLKSHRNGILNFSYKADHSDVDLKHKLEFDERKGNCYKAVPIQKTTGRLSSHLIGSWYDPTDSIYASFADWLRTGHLLENPTFKFTKDSFNIRTANFKTKGTYRVINGHPEVIILKSEKFFQNLMTINIDFIDSTEIRARFDKDYRLIRTGP